MKLDKEDLAILKVLNEDGRASLREVAARTSLSTPTVSHRLSRMKRAGLIRGFAPILDPKASHEVFGLVKLKVHARDVGTVVKNLAKMPEVRSVYVTTGGDNITVRLAADDVAGLQRFANRRLLSLQGAELVSTNIITEIVKDEHAVHLRSDADLLLRCDYCGGPVASDRPYNIRVGSTYHYFCCRTCRRSFLEGNRSRIGAINRREGARPHLHS